MAVVELAKPRRRAKLQFAMGAGLRFKAPAGESVIPCRDDHARGNLEWRKKCLTTRAPVKFKAVAGFHSNIDWRHKILPRFQYPFGIRHAAVLVFKKLLPYPSERPLF